MARIEIISVNEKSKGLLVIEEEKREKRSVPIMVETLTGATEEANMEFMEEVKMAYARYRSRVFQNEK